MAGPNDKKDKTTNTGELSALINLNPRAVEDDTKLLDRQQLKAAKKEAAVARKIERQADKFGPIGIAEKRKVPVFGALMALLLFVGGGGYWLFALQLVPTTAFGPTFQPMLDDLFSPIPKLEDVSAEDLKKLRAVVQLPIAVDGPAVEVALARGDFSKPVIYLSTNLPDATLLSFGIHGRAGKIASDRNVDIRFPVSPERHFFKSKPLTTVTGAIPPGEYEVTISDEDEQVPMIREKMLGKRLKFSTIVFLGGAKDAAFEGKLRSVIHQARTGATNELNAIANYVSTIESRLHATILGYEKLRKKQGKAAKLELKKFETSWTPLMPEPVAKTVYYGALLKEARAAWEETVKLHQLQASGASASSAVSEATGRVFTHLATLKAELENKRVELNSQRALPVREGT